jgi:branched-chain amino acid transport system substrate-binding protein
MMRGTTRVAVAAALLATVTACGGDDGPTAVTTTTATTESIEQPSATTDAADTTESTAGEPASGEPIVVGTLYVEAGGIVEAKNRDAMDSLFAAWNADGGIAGRPIELAAENGGLDPAASAASARKLVEEEQVVAMVLPLSPVDCQANGQYYEQKQVTVLFNISDECGPLGVTFPNGAPNADTLRVPSHWAVADQGAERIAYIGVDVPSSRAEGEAVRSQVEADGGEVVMEEYVPFIGVDVTSIAARLVQNEVDAVVASINPMELLNFLSVADAQGVGIPDGVLWVGSPVVYDEAVLPQLGATGEGLVTFSITTAASDPLLAGYLASWRADDPDRPMSGTVQTSWLAADVLRQLLESVDGEITRESVLAAAQAATSFESDIAPFPLPFVDGAPPTIAGFVYRIESAQFTPVSELISLG